jgi:hypothetical protein
MDRKERMSGRLSGSGRFQLSRRALAKMTSRFNVRNLTSRAADGMSLAIRETLITRTVTQMNPNPVVG